VADPAGTLAFGDASGYYTGYGTWTGVAVSFWYGPGGFPTLQKPCPAGLAQWRCDDYLRGRHFGGVNWAFADGHVKWLRSEQLFKASLWTPAAD